MLFFYNKVCTFALKSTECHPSVLLFGGTNGFEGSGIHSRSSQIASKSCKKEFEKSSSKGTENPFYKGCEKDLMDL